jgi:chemotaxis protein histidine kinase CheA
MTSDPTIREQTYPYFLQEVPELLQTLEQGLFNLQAACTLDQVHTLMRATHTLKGAAASVGLETITIIAHSLEDIFKALCRPDISTSPEIEALLFEGFECLRLPLTAELTGGSINNAEVLDRAATIFARLQEGLGDCFGQEAYLPTSAELGFDVTHSIFEVGVVQRLERIAAAIATEQPEEVSAVLRTQAEVFLGLAESLNLVGFGNIAQATIAALDHYPEQSITIAELALSDFQAGQAAVLSGDRGQGGQPCERLQQLADLKLTDPDSTELSRSLSLMPALPEDIENEANHLLVENIWGAVATNVAADITADIATADLIDDNLINESIADSTTETDVELTTAFNSAAPETVELSELVPDRIAQPPVQRSSPTPMPVKDSASTPTVRVNVEHLEQLSTSIGELLTNQNNQFLQTEQLTDSVRTLLTRLQQQQQFLGQLQQQFRLAASQQGTAPKQKSGSAKGTARKSAKPNSGFARKDKFDQIQRSIQSLLDNTVQLTEVADAINLFAQQSDQTLQRQQNLLTTTRNAVIEARMLPLGEIFARFPRILQQLEVRHNKQVDLSLQGSDVLVDKVIAEKLYEPLLHLIRNAFDHGIEPVAVRQQHGKAEKGQIEIKAYHQGRYLVIEVRDDGAGLDFDRIRQRAIEQQRLPSDPGYLSQAQLTNLLFEPGFSTAAQVSDLSGRGVGLDVVRNQVQAVQGEIAVHSERHQGTIFTLKLPLNLTISNLLICQAAGKTYALFADAIEQVFMPDANQVYEQYGIRVLRWTNGNQQQIPIYRLATTLVYSSMLATNLLPQTVRQDESAKESAKIILCRYRGSLLGLEVDQVLGEQELVIRPLKPIVSSPG